ncbi:MAG TPA: succinate dehydrogenase, cytochrome b556 subunit [Usitatibacter sp.]|nr:succinate dehydrogenase, cytochrome b556 subunit [Usitatibacter sp.]
MYRVYSIHNWMFILHRLTGTALLIYFIAHVLTVSTALIAGPEAFTAVMKAFRNPAFRAVELGIVGCIAFHGLNGLHIIATERGWLRERRDAYSRATVAATLGIWALAAVAAVMH